MGVLKYKGYEGSAELDMERQVCRGKLLFIGDLITYEGATPGELQREFEAAVDDYLATCAELGREPKKTLKGMFNVRIPPELHVAASCRALADGVSLNDVVVRSIDAFLSVGADVKVNHHVVVSVRNGEVGTLISHASQPLQWSTKHVSP